ncbi:Nif3-like dinuclear metal center hexameric protein [Desulfoscipio gibsoniae]|uniref:GTP cyclohydrolase 1 type 2 homolog n=1 Tax=Desulfoscipio gibsoniae DSM 7213 TaxID=767817 RepID=R4KK33_9FIRM|nr:Nif3-like dinuclear metal center hexameric protein [Desulfoscipio gibsoniae]AGL00905.1 dinuclear metal center protein, YbgI/SA1388 family [Desulfoscipio gibsoniae DSM 7213]
MVDKSKVVLARDLVRVMERLAPLELAEEWDNSGWQVGDPDARVHKVLLALDVTPEVVDEAVGKGVQLIISHHPMLLKGVKALRRDNPAGSLLFRLIQAGIGVYSAHTSLDSAEGGVNDVLARVLGLQQIEVLQPVRYQQLLKLVVFVPAAYADAVREALGRAGAGHIGNYSHCTFNLNGTGTFYPREGTSPFIGKVGRLERVEEVRIETIINKEKTGEVVRAMLEAHPYEEVAYDLYPLENKGAASGLGRIGRLPLTVTLAELAGTVQQVLQGDCLRYGGDPHTLVQRIAVCGGSGGDLWPQAGQKGADVLVTGDVRYHAARDMLAAGMSFIDAGHFATERVVLPPLREQLTVALAQAGLAVEIAVATCETEPWIGVR